MVRTALLALVLLAVPASVLANEGSTPTSSSVRVRAPMPTRPRYVPRAMRIRRPTFGQRILGAVRGAIRGFRRGTALPRRRAIALPDVRQATRYTCGAASLQSVLAYYGRGGDFGEGVLAEELGSDDVNGTAPDAMVRMAERAGLRATMREHMTLADLEGYVERGVPVIVDYQAWSDQEGADYSDDWTNGHYSVVVGIDEHNVYLEDPAILGSRGGISRQDFMARWHDEARGQRYHQLGIALESDAAPRHFVRVRRVTPTP